MPKFVLRLTAYADSAYKSEATEKYLKEINVKQKSLKEATEINLYPMLSIKKIINTQKQE